MAYKFKYKKNRRGRPKKNPFNARMTPGQVYKVARTRKAQRWAGFSV